MFPEGKKTWGWASHRVVCWKVGWLVGRKICQEYPVPGGDKDILAFDVSMTDALLMALSYCLEQLVGNPVL